MRSCHIQIAHRTRIWINRRTVSQFCERRTARSSRWFSIKKMNKSKLFDFISLDLSWPRVVSARPEPKTGLIHRYHGQSTAISLGGACARPQRYWQERSPNDKQLRTKASFIYFLIIILSCDGLPVSERVLIVKFFVSSYLFCACLNFVGWAVHTVAAPILLFRSMFFFFLFFVLHKRKPNGFRHTPINLYTRFAELFSFRCLEKPSQLSHTRLDNKCCRYLISDSLQCNNKIFKFSSLDFAYFFFFSSRLKLKKFFLIHWQNTGAHENT